MHPVEWMRSVYLSFGVRLDAIRDRDARSRLLLACDIVKETGCWRSRKAMFQLPGKRVKAQRAAYAMFVGPIQDAETINATCGDARCCLGEHLQCRRQVIDENDVKSMAHAT